ncbi:helix-turn-helix domain-containing protein [Halobacillus sp. Marseille-P3879]|uniref:helix-turn-helix domain-containing protein n=1 Tax=Halobacillus sp. Marseille-P3879 TaxID=2045014 RepID=UPI000C7ACB21|nr:helix-turn-helix domain-containing protein [Halobacillus sp. Marseille-P3879]
MFRTILLKCIQSLNGERSVSGIFHLLQGKRSSQTLQDAKIYEIDCFFGIYPELEKERLNDAVRQLAKENAIKIKEDELPVISAKGCEMLRASSLERDGHFFNGLLYHKHVATFEKRLRLLIQTLTHSYMNDLAFIPVEDDAEIQNWVKKIYKSHHNEGLMLSLHQDLLVLLHNVSEVEAELFTGRLTGGSFTGRTREQLALSQQISIENVDLYLRHTFYYLFHTVTTAGETYKGLSLCMDGLEISSLITESAKQTYQLFIQGYSLQQICQQRRLKLSTIQDHMVEAALVLPSFDIIPFVSLEHQTEIIHTLNAMNSNKLKSLYEALHGQFNYFELRLVLARANSKKQGRKVHGY